MVSILKRFNLLWGLFLVVVFLPGCGQSAVGPTDGRSIPLETCHLSGGVEAMCGSLAVPENRSLTDGRILDLNIAVIPATSSFPEPDPLFLLAGGPGQAATEVFGPFIALLEDINETRDIVLVDQRGTGESSPLVCDKLSEEENDLSLEDKEVVELLHACAEEMAETADLTQYTTDVAAADLDAVREALGYEQINLYGLSYGTRAALAYARLYPQFIRTITLDAVAGPELILFFQMPKDGQRALELLFDRCASDEVCSEKFPDFEAEYESILAGLESDSQEIKLDHPLSGEEVEFTLTADRLANFVYAILYSTDMVSLLPLLVHEAYESGDFAPLVSQGILISEGTGMNLGLLYAVTCSEDARLIDMEEAETIQAETLFAPRVDFFLQVCQAFPQAEVDAEFRQPLVSDLPVLLFSGNADPVTPPAYAEQVADNLANSLHIVVPHYGHGLLAVGCSSKIVGQFVTEGSVDNLETNCLDILQPPPFFVDFSGPEA